MLRELELDQVVRLYRTTVAQAERSSGPVRELQGLCAQPKGAAPGDAPMQWLFVAARGEDDPDEADPPFTERAGALVGAMMSAIGMAGGETVSITDDRQVEAIGPKLIVALGRTAAARLLGTDAGLASLRGRVHRFNGIPLIVTYHPVHLLRTLPDKARAWEDLLLARRTLREAA